MQKWSFIKKRKKTTKTLILYEKHNNNSNAFKLQSNKRKIDPYQMIQICAFMSA